ncbi:MAG: hypothetical protein JXM70_11735 [Pirellulales bacterium]|nr:hypothetical protein [Pirellulales bacterium]
MPNWPFRFVHAADFHLEMPPFGVTEVPEHLRELFLESAYMAAERVFETVIAEEADFLVLCGDILRCEHTGPRGPLFLVDQFERLASRGIGVYWASGRVDPHNAWPPSIRLPNNVHLFPQSLGERGRPEEFIHRRDGTPMVRLIGAGCAKKGRIHVADFDPSEPGLFAIAVTHGRADAADFETSRVDYWALGGRHQQSTILHSNPMAHYSGSPQGRQPEETGTHGCTLVQVDEHSQIQISQIPTDVLRWHSQEIEVDETTTPEQLESILQERTRSLIDSTPGTDQLISWTVTGSGPLLTRLRSGPIAGQYLEKIRAIFGATTPATWSVSLSAKMTASPPREWYEPSTIRGDFLQTIKYLKKEPDEPLPLECYLPEGAGEDLLSVAAVGRGGRRRNVLHDAALLGVDLLTGEEVRS